ncbi:MAG: serine hydrolase [Chitinophagaceae bacterium]|nr:serine hydrolase [Chitinophagaceae bacterium]MCW5927069.1 serine hydrolase [Chitinophagaceae bacterium]
MVRNKRRPKTAIIIIVIVAILPLFIGKPYLYKAIAYNFANIDDYKIFDNNIVSASPQPAPWPLDDQYTQKIPDDLNSYLEKIRSAALLVIQDGKIKVEKYWLEYNDSSVTNSFSIAKSITSLLTGIAIQEGKIASVNDPVGKYLPEFASGEKAKLKIVHLLTMSSGSNWDESYANPLSVTTEAYYGSDLYKTATSVDIIKEPGTYHFYKSGDTQLLGLVLEKATGRSLSDYASEKLWRPLGAEHPALWSTDKKGGYEKAYCCFNSNARDFARLGQLMLDSGRINGTPLIDSAYYARSITPCNIPDDTGTPCNYYGYQWWIIPNEPSIYYARGILGQYIICIPQKNMVIVRLGEKRDEKVNDIPLEVFRLIEWGKTL